MLRIRLEQFGFLTARRTELLDSIENFLGEPALNEPDLTKGLLEQTPHQHKICSMIDFKTTSDVIK
jgi:hypothetical protein